MANELTQLYRKYLADTGQTDARDDFYVTKELGDWAHRSQPDLFELYPDFGKEWGQIREANAPSLGAEAGRAFKRAGIGLGSTALGGAALLTGSDYLKRKAAALSLQASDPDLASTIPTLEDIAPGRTGAGKAFSRDALRYGLSKVGEAAPSIGEAIALGLAGGAIGSAIEPGVGTIAGAAEGVAEGLIGRGIIRKAIKSLVTKELGEEAIVQGLRKGVPEVVQAVTKNAKALAGARWGTGAAALNSYLLNAGEVYGENDDRATAAGLGLISAIPDTVLPALVVKRLFRGVNLSVGREAAKELVGSNAIKVAKAAGVVGFEGGTESFQEAVDIVARNLKNGVDPLTITDADKIRIREAGITGAVGGGLAAPAVVLERAPEEIVQKAPAIPAQEQKPAVMAPLTPAVIAPVLLPAQRILAMSPEQQAARLAELGEKTPRAGDEEAEYQILRQVAPRPTPPVAVPPMTLGQITTSEPPNEFGALSPVAATAPVIQPIPTQAEKEAFQRAAAAGQAYALPRNMVGEPIAPELEAANLAPVAQPIPSLQESASEAGSAPNPRSGVEAALAPALPPLAETPAPEAAIQKIVSPTKAAIEKLAESKGIPWDYDPDFMAFTKQLTGKEHIHDLTPEQRTQLYQAIERGQRPEVPALAPLDRALADAEAQLGDVDWSERRNMAQNLRTLREIAKKHGVDPAKLRQAVVFEAKAGEQPVNQPAAVEPNQRQSASPSVESAVAKMAPAKKLKAQKEFLSKAARDAAADAPPMSAEMATDLKHLKTLPARAMGEAREMFARKYGDFVTIEVPDDGTFRIHNTKEALTGFADKVDKRFGRGLGAPGTGQRTLPKATPEELAEYRVPANEIIAEAAQGDGGSPAGVVAEVEPTPPSMIKRRELRAELAAAGITEIKGTPLADARPNQLMAEVGRLRASTAPQAARGGTPALDSTAPNALQFRDARPDEISASDRQVLADFSTTFGTTFTAVEPDSGSENNGPLNHSLHTDAGQLVGARLREARMVSLRREFEQSLGKRIIFFRVDTPISSNGLSALAHKNVILVNSSAPNSTTAIIGHELGHDLKNQNPKLHATLTDLVLGIKPPPQSYLDERRRLRYTASEATDEYISDIIGDRFTEQTFWHQLGRTADERGLGAQFRQLVDWINQWLSDFLSKFTSKRGNMSNETQAVVLPEIEAIRKAVAEAVVEFTGRQSGQSPAPRTSTEPTNPAVRAQRTQEFQAVMGRLVSNGANVQTMSQELLKQQTGEALQQQIQALQQRLAQATTAPQRDELQRKIDFRMQRLTEVENMRGVTYGPYHIAIAMDDAMNASMDNLVTLLHEAAESLTMRLTPAQRGAVFRAVEAATAQMQAKMQAAAKNTGAVVADAPNPGELLAETMAQTLAAEGIPEAPSLADAIVRWIKEIYYRTAMAAQRMFGAEPNPELAINWYENQLRREVGGDYEYAFGNLLDRFLPQSNAAVAQRFTGAHGTPGGMVDFFDPARQEVRQPWFEPTSDEALAWDMKFETMGVSPAETEGIPADEANARITAAVYNAEIEWLTKLHGDIAPTMEAGEFMRLVSPGQKTPQEMLGVLESLRPGVATARLGGERMTDTMNGRAHEKMLIFSRSAQEKIIRASARSQETVRQANERFVEHATELNRMEPDARNRELHEAELKKRARGIIDGLLKSYANGNRTASKLGMMVEAEESLGDRDPLPQFYAQVFDNLKNAQVPLFDYVEAVALLDLPVSDMTPEQIWKAIRDNADTSEKLRELSRNKPLAMTISVLARNNSRQIDQIQLRRAGAEEFLDIHRELEGIRNATEAQLREMLKALDEGAKAKGLRQRIKAAYLRERRLLKSASDSMAAAEERIAVLEKAKPRAAEQVGLAEQAVGGIMSDWQPVSGADLIVMRRQPDGNFQKATRKLEFTPEGPAVDSDGIYNDLAQNEQWLRENQAKAGQKFYNEVLKQTREMQLLDISRLYPAHNYGKLLGFIDGFVRPLQAIAQQAGGAAGARIGQRFNQYVFINRSWKKSLQSLAYQWVHAQNSVMKSAGIKDVGQFLKIRDTALYFIGVNPGLDQAQAIRGATKVARSLLTKEPTADFNARLERFLLIDHENNAEMLKYAEDAGVFVSDPKLRGDLRHAMARGWTTGMRAMNGAVVATLVTDMQKAGWKIPSQADPASTFSALQPPPLAEDKAGKSNRDTRAEYFSQLENTEVLRAALKPYFTPGILDRWLKPFINKPGEAVFSHDGREISQLDLQNAWAKSGEDVLNWIDNLGQAIGATAEEGVSAAASFRADMLKQIDDLFAWEAKMAHEANQVPDLFNNQGTKLHVMMDARVNDLLPPEHVRFLSYDPESSKQTLGHIAFHGAFGRNGAALVADLKELTGGLKGPKLAFDSLPSTTVEGKKRDARALGFEYEELKLAAQRFSEVEELRGKIEAAMGVNNIYGPLHDTRALMELLGMAVGQIVDQPKTGALNFVQIAQRPFASHSLGPMALKSIALSYGELAKNIFASTLQDVGIDLIRISEMAKETGEVEGRAFKRLPYAVVMSDMGKEGSFQTGVADRTVIKVGRRLRALQERGVGPGIVKVPGFGVMSEFGQQGAMAANRGSVYLLQEIINRGIRHFAAHPEDLANPAFRFTAKSLKMKYDRGMYDSFRNKTVEFNMGPIEKIVRAAMARQESGERTITAKMVGQLAQMNAQELDGASSINTTPSGMLNNPALKYAMPLLRWPLWMMHAAHKGLASAEGRADFRSFLAGVGRLAAINLPLGLAFTFLIDEYDDKILRKKNANPRVEKVAGVPFIGPALALATTPRSLDDEIRGMAQRIQRAGNIYGLGADLLGTAFTSIDPGSGQRAFSLDQRIVVMSLLSNLMQATRNMVSQGGVATWGSVYRPLVTSIGGNGMLQNLDVINNLLGLDNAEARLNNRINAARWINTAAKELGIATKGSTGYSTPTPLSVWTREMQLAAMANSRIDFMEAYRRALIVAREKVAEDDRIPEEAREKEAAQRVLQSWRSRNPFSGLAATPTPEQVQALLRVMDDRGRANVQDAARHYESYSQLIEPSPIEKYLNRRMRPPQNPLQQMESLRRRAAGSLMFSP